MTLRTKGIANKINTTVVGIVTRDLQPVDSNHILLIQDKENKTLNELLPLITTLSIKEFSFDSIGVFNVEKISHLSEGDIVALDKLGNVNTIYRINSLHNALLVTERCNSNCLMCSQPPRNVDDIEYHFEIHKKVIPLIPKECGQLGLTGGEPTLLGVYFFQLLELLKLELPETEIHVLTNGRTFAKKEFVQKLTEINHNKVIFGIPLYSDYYVHHDYIVQAKSAYVQTLIGLHNLARLNQRIELRIVLHKLTIPRLTNWAEFIYKNLPFVEHVAFMGLENTGYTPFNIDKLWIDPVDYQTELEESVLYLSTMGMNVSIFNHQLCVLSKELWPFNQKAISDWKNIYLDECDECTKKSLCGGFFSFNKNLHSRNIKAIRNNC